MKDFGKTRITSETTCLLLNPTIPRTYGSIEYCYTSGFFLLEDYLTLLSVLFRLFTPSTDQSMSDLYPSRLIIEIEVQQPRLNYFKIRTNI